MLSATKIQVWATTCDDSPGGAMRKLEGLAKSGANLELVSARRLEKEPGKGVLLVAPLRNARETAMANQLGFRALTDKWVIRVEGCDEPGLAYLFAAAVAKEGISLDHFSGMVIRGQFVMFLAVDSQADADRIVTRLNQAL